MLFRSTSVTGKTLYDLLGSTTVKDYDFEITIDGVSDPKVFDGFANDKTNEYWPLFNKTHLNRNNDKAIGGTGNGVLTQVFIDTNDKTVYIAVINTYLAFAQDDYDEKNELVDLEVHDIDEVEKGVYAKRGTDETIAVTAEQFDITDVKKGETFLVTVADGDIQSMEAPEMLSAVEITTFTKSSLTTGGTTYDFASSMEFDHSTLRNWTDGNQTIELKDLTYNVYLDEYGYVIGVEVVEAPNNYLFITGVNGNYNNLANISIKANAIFLDGTSGVITINGKKSDWKDDLSNDTLDLSEDDGATINRWFTYTKSSDGTYTVKLVNYGANGTLGQFHENRDGTGAKDTIDYKKHNVKVDVNNDLYTTAIANPQVVYSNDDTVFLTASLDQIETSAGNFSVIIDGVDSMAVGIDNVDITPWNHGTVKAIGKFSNSVINHDDPTKWNCNAATTPLDSCNLSYGAYSLYDERGYIIGMVVVGEDNGMSDNLVYIDSSSVKSESYDKATEKWTWVRNAIVNGERVELIEVNDTGISLLKDMDNSKWYRVRYNADGHITKVTALTEHLTGCASLGGAPCDCLDFDGDYNDYWGLNPLTVTPTPNLADRNVPNPPYAYVTDYEYDAIYDAITTVGVNVVLYHERHVAVTPTNSAYTLYMTGEQDKASGVRYTEDTNIVFIQTERNKSYTEFWKGENGVKKALKALHELHKDNNDYSYEIGIVWKDGRATAIVIRDLNDQGNDGEWAEKQGDVYLTRDSKINGANTMEELYNISNEQVTVQPNGDVRFEFTLKSQDDISVITDPYGNTLGVDGNHIVYAYRIWREDTKGNMTHSKTMYAHANGTWTALTGSEVEPMGFLESRNVKVEIMDIRVCAGAPVTRSVIPASWCPDPAEHTAMPVIIKTGVSVDNKNLPSGVSKIEVLDANGDPINLDEVSVDDVVTIKLAPTDKNEFKAGESYKVTINGKTVVLENQNDTNGDLIVKWKLTAKDLGLNKLVVESVVPTSDEPGTNPEPGKPVDKITVTMGAVEGGKALPTPAVGTGMKVENVVWNPADETAKFETEYTLTFDVALTGANAKWAENVTVTGLEGATISSDGNVMKITYTVTTGKDPNGGTVEPVGPETYAKLDDATKKYVLYNYKGEALTPEKVVAAIAAAVNVDASKVILATDGASAMVDGSLVQITTGTGANAGSATNPKTLVKVTVGKTTLYVEKSATATIEGLEANAKYLFKGTLVGVADAIADANGKATDVDLNDTGVFDFELVKAMELTTTLTSNDAVQYFDADGTPTDMTSGNVFVEGLKLRVKKSNVNAGETVLATVNGEVVATGENDTATSKVVYVTIPADKIVVGKDGKVTINVATGAVTVTVDGTPVTNDKGSKYIREGDYVEVTENVTYITGLTNGAPLDATTIGGKAYIQITSAMVSAAVNGKLEINSAAEVKTLDASVVGTVTVGEENATNIAKYVAVGAQVNVPAKKAYTVLGSDTLTLTWVEPSDKDYSKAYVYTFQMPDAEVKADAIKVAYALTAADPTAEVSFNDFTGKAGEKYITVAGTGLKDVTPFTAKWKAEDAFTAKVTLETSETSRSGAEIKLTTEANDIAANDTATIVVTIGDIVVEFAIKAIS